MKWIKIEDRLPIRFSQVLMESDIFPTYSVCIYDPTDKEFPIVIYSGFDTERFALDCFTRWAEIHNG